jgi:hypothetical protein
MRNGLDTEARVPHLLLGIRLWKWASALSHFPTIDQVMRHWGCSRATAFRWTAYLAEEFGIDVETRHARTRISIPSGSTTAEPKAPARRAYAVDSRINASIFRTSEL